MEPSYLKLYKTGELSQRIERAYLKLKSCNICPRECKVDRTNDKKGKCLTGKNAVVSSYNPHFGEEPPLVGRYGSGTIFFTHCNLNCIYCQNYDISQYGMGYEVSDNELADMMLSLQRKGCHNINFVSPTHVVPQILKALFIAIQNGLKVPLVYNTGGYDSIETLKILDGVFDIYMPDMKYSDPEIGKELSGVKDYPRINQECLKEMYSQVGDLVIEDGIAQRGLLIRHLVLPENLAGTEKICEFISKEISKESYVNIMSQYHPCYKAFDHSILRKSLRTSEFIDALSIARSSGLHRLARSFSNFL